MDFLYFVLFVSILIFIHEFGHFAFAKLFGVKVLTFSIGFGPKVLKVRGKETEYCIGVLPFGGFVKMLEEGKAEHAILPEERHRTFEAQPLWKRVVIVLAGPAMNLVFPIALYTSVYLDDKEFLPPTVGAVFPGKPAEGKLFAGDTITVIDGVPVQSFPEVQKAFAKHAAQPMRVTLDRDGKSVDVEVTPSDEVEVVEPSELELYEHVGRVGIAPTFAAPVIGIPRTDSPAWRAGLRTFDRVTAVNGRKIDTLIDLQKMLSQNRGDNVVLTYVRPVPVPQGLGGLCDFAVLETGIASLAPKSRPEGAANRELDPDARARDVLDRTGIEGVEMYVAFVPQGSSEYKMGLRAGDRVTDLDGAPQRMWKVERRGGHSVDDTSMVGMLLREPNRMHELVWTRDGERRAGTFQLRKERWDDDLGQHYERYVFRTTHWQPRVASRLVPNPHPVLYAAKRGFEETVNAIKFIVVGFVRIAQGPRQPRGRQRADNALRRCRRRGREGDDLLRLGDGRHERQPRSAQLVTNPCSRRRASAALLRGMGASPSGQRSHACAVEPPRHQRPRGLDAGRLQERRFAQVELGHGRHSGEGDRQLRGVT